MESLGFSIYKSISSKNRHAFTFSFLRKMNTVWSDLYVESKKNKLRNSEYIVGCQDLWVAEIRRCLKDTNHHLWVSSGV